MRTASRARGVVVTPAVTEGSREREVPGAVAAHASAPDAMPRSGTLRLLGRALAARGARKSRVSASRMSALGTIARKAVTFRIAGVRLYIASGVQVYVQRESGGPTARPRLLNGKAGRVFWDKALTSAIIRSAGLPAPDSYKISDGERLLLRHVFTGLSPVAPNGLVVKPNRGLHGKHVYLNITRVETFAAAVAAAMVVSGAVLVEPMVMGTTYRFFIVNGVVVGVRYGLVETGHSNRHQGARIVAADDVIHVSYKRMAERIVALFDGRSSWVSTWRSLTLPTPHEVVRTQTVTPSSSTAAPGSWDTTFRTRAIPSTLRVPSSTGCLLGSVARARKRQHQPPHGRVVHESSTPAFSGSSWPRLAACLLARSDPRTVGPFLQAIDRVAQRRHVA